MTLVLLHFAFVSIAVVAVLLTGTVYFYFHSKTDHFNETKANDPPTQDRPAVTVHAKTLHFCMPGRTPPPGMNTRFPAPPASV
ncbi:MAG: hypothetical protein AAF989_09780 [Planctomycetota bacterium]